MVLPEPVNGTAGEVVSQSAVPTTAQLNVTPVRLAGTASLIDAPVTFDGPLLVIVSV